MYSSFSTHLLPHRERQTYWKEVIENTYFPLELTVSGSPALSRAAEPVATGGDRRIPPAQFSHLL